MARSAPPGEGQGDALATWLLWALVLAAVAVTYARVPPAELYHVSRGGLGGGLSRALVVANFPLSLVAVALVLVAMGALPRAAWWAGGPAIALAAVTAWPGVVDEADLDARPVNALPALGLVVALGLTVAATRRAGARPAPRRPLDRARLGVALVVVVLSLPWLAADLGWYLPEIGVITSRVVTEPDGTALAAVHLGHHHGLDGALLVLSALLLSRPRPRPRRLGQVARAYVSLMAAYGAVNLVQDLWFEQVVKRGWSRWEVPPALEPAATPVWLVIVALALLTALALGRDAARPTGGRRG